MARSNGEDLELQPAECIEGDEEVEYVIMEMPTRLPPGLWQPGSNISLQDLDSDSPSIVLPDGTKLCGQYREQLGSSMVFLKHPTGRQIVLKAVTEQRLEFQVHQPATPVPPAQPPNPPQYAAASTQAKGPALRHVQLPHQQQHSGPQSGVVQQQQQQQHEAGQGQQDQQQNQNQQQQQPQPQHHAVDPRL